MDYGNHRSVSIPQPPPLSLHGIGGQSSSASSLLVSNERGIPRDPKRTHRPGLHLHSRSPSDNPSDPNSGPYAHQGGGGGQGPFGSSRGGAQYAPHHAHHGQQHHHGSGQYQPFFPVSAHQSPPPSFIPLQSDFPRASTGSRSGPGAGGGAGFGIPARTASSSSYDAPGMYSSMMRGQPPAGGPGAGGGGGDPFAAFLDADEQSQHHHHQGQAPQGPGFFSNPSAAGSSAGPDAAGNSNNNGNWLDFLSGNNPNAPAPPPPSGARDASMSWERGGPPPGGADHGRGGGDIADMFGGAGDRGRAGSGGGGGGMGGKRKGEDEGPGGILASPASVNGRGGEGKKEGMKDGTLLTFPRPFPPLVSPPHPPTLAPSSTYPRLHKVAPPAVSSLSISDSSRTS
ncbi:hypothetical protein BJ912DRAFT_1141393 [Pholiota molesta]|nr:hypothetical protein BJ912DRAFT_1141393 [Pholiota molesta]